LTADKGNGRATTKPAQTLRSGDREISAKLMTWTSRKGVLGFSSTFVVCGIFGRTGVLAGRSRFERPPNAVFGDFRNWGERGLGWLAGKRARFHRS
jgi:hypothetical protein